MLPAFKFELYGQYKGRRVEMPIFDGAIVACNNAISNYKPVFEQIAPELAQFVLGQFYTEGDQGGVPWQKLADSTVKQRGSEHPILVRGEGLLRESFTEGGADHLEEISETRMLWGSGKPYALFHQTGTGRGFKQDEMETMGPKVFDMLVKQRVEFAEGKRKAKDVQSERGMPRRRILKPTEEMQTQIFGILLGRVTMEARRAGFRVSGRGTSPADARKIGLQQLSAQAMDAWTQ